MTQKTINEQMEEIEKGCGKEIKPNHICKKTKWDSCGDLLCQKCQGRKSQLQTDMKIVKELEKEIEQLKERIEDLENTLYEIGERE